MPRRFRLRGVLKWGALAALGLFLLIQALPFGWNRTNPAAHTEPPWDSARTRELAVAACYDCHSNRTDWPWYSYVAPASWLVVRDVENGRAALNFSIWQEEVEGEADDLVEVVLYGEMPPWPYTLAHADARLSADEKRRLADGLALTFGGSLPARGEGESEEEREDE